MWSVSGVLKHRLPHENGVPRMLEASPASGGVVSVNIHEAIVWDAAAGSALHHLRLDRRVMFLGWMVVSEGAEAVAIGSLSGRVLVWNTSLSSIAPVLLEELNAFALLPGGKGVFFTRGGAMVQALAPGGRVVRLDSAPMSADSVAVAVGVVAACGRLPDGGLAAGVWHAGTGQALHRAAGPPQCGERPCRGGLRRCSVVVAQTGSMASWLLAG